MEIIMPNVESLIGGDSEQFRKQVYDALYDKVKEQLQNKKQEIAATIYSSEGEEESEECSDCQEE